MATPTLPTNKPLALWKRLATISFFGGAGFALILSAIIGVFVWYSSRPKPPVPWNTDALVSKESPGFDVSRDGKGIQFWYSVENTTNTDYQIESNAHIKLMARDKEGTFSQPLPPEVAPLRLPVFIPAKQKGALTLSLVVSGIPERKAAETDEEYHERLRAYCEGHVGGVSGFVLFDDTNRYEINLPKWLSEQSKKKH